MKKRILSVVMTVTMVASMVMGCGTKEETTEKTAETTAEVTEGGLSKEYDGTTITLSCASTPYISTITENLDEFYEATGITVEIDQLENAQLSNKIAVSSAAGGSDLDVILYRPIQENKLFIENGWLEPLSEYISESSDWDYDDYTETSKDITCDSEGTSYGVPLVTEREILYYNTEMLEAAGYSEGPADFDELLEYCEKLNDPDNGVYALGLRGEGNSAVTQFSGFLYGFGGDFYDADGKATINTPEFVEALQYYGKLCREYCPDGVMNAGWSETSNWFTQGVVAMRVDCDSQYSYALDPNSSLIADKVGYSVLPGGDEGSKPFNIVAWAAGISANSENKGAAWEFIKWATSKEIDLKAQQGGNFSARNSTWADPASTSELPEQLVEVITLSNEVAQPYDRPYMKDAGEARTAIGELITMAIEGVSDDELMGACDKVNKTVQGLLDAENAK